MKLFSKIAAAIAVTAATISAPAMAEDKGFYATLAIGGGDFSSIDVGSTEIDFDPGLNLEGGIGYDYGNNWRTEVTYDSTESDGYSVFNVSLNDETTVEHVLASVYYDFKTDGKKFSPFVGISLGQAWVSNGGETADAFAFGISVGANYDINEKSTLFGKLAHVRASDLEYSTVTITNAYDTSLKVGLRYKF